MRALPGDVRTALQQPLDLTAVGEKLLICLRKIEDPETKVVSWKAMSGGNEGEMPWHGDRIHVHGPTQLKGEPETAESGGVSIVTAGIALERIEELVTARKDSEAARSETEAVDPAGECGKRRSSEGRR